MDTLGQIRDKHGLVECPKCHGARMEKDLTTGFYQNFDTGETRCNECGELFNADTWKVAS
jgi:hypothetical protein